MVAEWVELNRQFGKGKNIFVSGGMRGIFTEVGLTRVGATFGWVCPENSGFLRCATEWKCARAGCWRWFIPTLRVKLRRMEHPNVGGGLGNSGFLRSAAEWKC